MTPRGSILQNVLFSPLWGSLETYIIHKRRWQREEGGIRAKWVDQYRDFTWHGDNRSLNWRVRNGIREQTIPAPQTLQSSMVPLGVSVSLHKLLSFSLVYIYILFGRLCMSIISWVCWLRCTSELLFIIWHWKPWTKTPSLRACALENKGWGTDFQNLCCRFQNVKLSELITYPCKAWSLLDNQEEKYNQGLSQTKSGVSASQTLSSEGKLSRRACVLSTDCAQHFPCILSVTATLGGDC